MRRRVSRFADVIALLVAFVVASLLVGLLAAGLAMPAIGATGAAARQGVHLFDTLPGIFTQTPLSQQSRILASDGSLIATPYVENRKIVPLTQVAKSMQQAQIDIEDNRFYSHGGVDLHGIARAIVANAQGGDIQGASTLTQQYVKITLQENAIRNGDKAAAAQAVAPNYTRKLQQLKYAVMLEQTQSKDQILQGYLNLVYYGGQAYGVEAAAERFFGIHASELKLAQSALLAGLVQEPTKLDPSVNPSLALKRRNVVLDTMHSLGHITGAQWKAARKSKLGLHLTPSRSSCAASAYPYYCNYILAWLREQPALGKTVAERNDVINREGLTIQTTFDPKIQAIAQRKINDRVPVGNSANIAAAATVVEPGTGKVLAMVQNTKYIGKHSTQINYNVDTKYGSSQGFQYGSTAKLYAVVAALQSGLTINSPIHVRALTGPKHQATFLPNEYRRDGCRQATPYTVGNDEGSTHARTLPLYQVLADSINVAFAGLIADLGLCTVHHVMDVMGVHATNGKSTETFAPSVTLGTDVVSPMTMATSYATVAAGGVYCKPIPVLAITTSSRKVLPIQTKQCNQAISPEIAAGAAEILKHVLTDGTAKGTGPVPGRPSGGKTGTTENNQETWFVGFTAQLATAVWVGTVPTPRPMHNVILNGKRVGGSGKVYGATVPAPIWEAITEEASKGMVVKGFGTVTDKIRNGDLQPVPDVSGMPTGSAIAALTGAGFFPHLGGKVISGYPLGITASSSPPAGTKARIGSSVTINVSGGIVAPPSPSAPAPSPTSSTTPPPTTSPPTPPPTPPAPSPKASTSTKPAPGPKH